MDEQRVVFVETAAQAAALERDSGRTVVAFTGEAAGALRRARVDHVLVGDLARPRLSLEAEREAVAAVVELLKSLESFLVARDERAARHVGFVTDHDYYAATALFEIAERELLIRDALRALGAGNAHRPVAGESGVAAAAAPAARRRVRRLPRALRRALVRREDGGGKRLLFLDEPKYDWAAVVAGMRGLDLQVIEHARVDAAHPWTFALEPRAFERRDDGSTLRLFDEWASEARTLRIGGLDLWPLLAPALRPLAGLGPALAEHCDRVAVAALDEHRPDAVCAFSLPWSSGRRLARRATERGVPVLCYQHGGAYATHRLVIHELMDWGVADVFLTYGEGIAPPAEPTFPIRARFVPVGSAAIAATRLRRRSSSRTRILWLGEYVTRNAFLFGMGEDTRRHRLEVGALARLAAAPDLDVTFRPYPAQVASSDVVEALNGSRVTVDVATPLAEQVAAHDLVITDTHSGTVWNQVLGWGAPLMLVLDPGEVHLDPAYSADLERACRWCRTDEEVDAVLAELERAPGELVESVRAIDATGFVRRYVLHDGSPVADVAAFLRSL